jgi:UDP-GlcNAc:undecaprenyl-phosphate/decaprenyl-phosphate GlcNAc-1-phosphate transferase
MSEPSGYLLIGAVAAVVTFLLTPPVGWIATRFGWVAEPEERRVHANPTPHIGGAAMFIGFLVAMLVASSLNRFDPLFVDNSEPMGVVLGCGLVFLVGFLDDVMDLSPPAKVTGIVLAGVVLVLNGVTMFNFRVPFLNFFQLDDWSPLVTVLWLLGMTQAVNLIDGLDGLAAGIVAIAAGSFFFYGTHLSDLNLLVEPNIGPLIAVIAVGVCVGFLPHNFNPARIFMGDGGALFLGALMATSTSVVGGRANPRIGGGAPDGFAGQTYFFLAPLFIPLFILGVPILDMLFAILRRATRRQGLATADKGHLHHRLMDLGHGQRRSVLILWLWTALLSGFVLYPVYSGSGAAVAPFVIVALCLALYTVLHPQLRRVRDSPD